MKKNKLCKTSHWYKKANVWLEIIVQFMYAMACGLEAYIYYER